MKPLEGEQVKPSADIIDLTELLRRSLRKGGGASPDDENARPATARRKAANDEDETRAPRTRRAAATKASGRSTAAVKPKPRKKAA